MNEELNGGGFTIRWELEQIKNATKTLSTQVERIAQTVDDIQVSLSAKLDKDDFHRRMEEWPIPAGTNGSDAALWRALVKLLAVGITAAVSALTGAKLLE